jgi:plastocyanin
VIRITLLPSLFVALLSGSMSRCGDAPTSPATSDAAVQIKTFQFTPDTVRVSAGTRVTWTNGDDIEHTVTAGTPEQRDPRFDGKLATKGARFDVTLEAPGTYTYFCDRHQFMRGAIVVTR